jgi:hypothetical protein
MYPLVVIPSERSESRDLRFIAPASMFGLVISRFPWAAK